MKRKIAILLLMFTTLSATTVKADDKHKFHLARQVSIINAIIRDLNLFYVDSIMPEKMMKKTMTTTKMTKMTMKMTKMTKMTMTI